MRFSEHWLREFVDLPVDTERLLEQFNLLGLEVDGCEPAAPAFDSVVVGEIVEIGPHPDADKLRVCRVEAGQGEPLQIVCGAANAAKGLKAPLALIGAVLPGGLKIKKSKLRGVESFGMLCSEAELGLADRAEGLMALPADAPPGAGIREYLDLDDAVIEIDLTPNRGDCLGMIGLAREAALANSVPFEVDPAPAIKPQIDETFPVTLSAAGACPRYAGRVVRDIDPDARTPLWMVEKLRRGGIRAIHPVVDITNYVMLETGQPMHAFDLDRLEGGIDVRMNVEDEPLVLLDGTEIRLTGETLVIADSRRPLALAGIMGGAGSGVSDQTRHIFFESAWFAPEAIMGRARRYGLHTDSSHRFERGVDPQLQAAAIERATALLLEVAGGRPGPVSDIHAAAGLPDFTELVEERYRSVVNVSTSRESEYGSADLALLLAGRQALVLREQGVDLVPHRRVDHAGQDRVGAAVWDLPLLLQGIPPEQISVAFDIRHATVGGGQCWPLHFRRIYEAGLLGMVYVKDDVWTEGGRNQDVKNVPLGEGMVQRSFFTMLKDAGYRGPISLHEEYLDHRDPALVPKHLAAFRRDLATLRSWLKAA
jgi:phenylalanyl-tRNA synthetase beta subunit